METILAAAITGVLALAGVIITNNKNQALMDAKLDRRQAVTDTKIEELTREVREHNNFARRMPVVEERLKVMDHRVDGLERLHKPEQGGRSA